MSDQNMPNILGALVNLKIYQDMYVHEVRNINGIKIKSFVKWKLREGNVLQCDVILKCFGSMKLDTTACISQHGPN